MRYEVTTQLSPQEAIAYAKDYFGPQGVGLEVINEQGTCIILHNCGSSIQLGSGCSAMAIAAGRSVDTSRGVKPLEGLMMGTRAGDIDPALPGFLARKEGIEPGEVAAWLNTRSGLLGVSERSSDMR